MKDILLTVASAAALVAILFGGAIFFSGGWNSTTKAAEDISTISTRPEVPYTPLPEAQRFHGVAIQLHNCDLLDQFKQSIREVAATGADTVELSLAAYQENASSSTISIDLRKAPNREQMVELIKLAKSLKLRVIIMPIVLLENPRGNEWRGRIVPEDPDRWWADYREYIKYYARAGAEGGADVLIVGSELNKLEESLTRWRDLIKFVRTEFPKLKLAYSANWDRYWKVHYWDALDFAGVTTYYTLADEEEPAVDDVVKAWQPHKDWLVKWQKTEGKPLIFTEVGWYSRKGVATRPWDYYYNQGKPSPLEQANLYEAFLRVWQNEPGVGGVIFWEWTVGEGGPAEEGYTPEGKPAEKIMRDFFRTRACPATQPSS